MCRTHLNVTGDIHICGSSTSFSNIAASNSNQLRRDEGPSSKCDTWNNFSNLKMVDRFKSEYKS